MQPGNITSPVLHSTLAPLLQQFLAEKRAQGHRYDSLALVLRTFDRYLQEQNVVDANLPRALVETWVGKRPQESTNTQANRFYLTCQVCRFLERQGYAPFIPPFTWRPKVDRQFTPYIFSEDEVYRLFDCLDHVHSHPRAPQRARIVPLVFRLLYGCGLRINEVLHLRVQDVDSPQAILTIREAKLQKDRLIPVAPSLAVRLRNYTDTVVGHRAPDAFFFQAPDGGAWCSQVFYGLFRAALQQCGIAHKGHGHGPRVHDLRHTFACHRLAHWLREGVAVDLALPILATYMGHESVYETQRYLHLFPQLYPEITGKLTAYCGTVIPTVEVLNEAY